MTVGNFQEALFSGRMYNQGLFEESKTQKHPLGFVRPLEDGREFVYALNGAVALSPGRLLQVAVPIPNHLGMGVAAVAAIGDKRLLVTPGATDMAANAYKDGFIHINTSTGVGYSYKVRGHKAITGSSSGYIELYDSLRAALDTTSKATITKQPADSVIVFPTSQTGAPAGVAHSAVTIGYHFWMQVKGPVAMLTDGTLVIGDTVMPSTAVEGAISPETAGGAITCVVGSVLRVNANTFHSLINLNIPGY